MATAFKGLLAKVSVFPVDLDPATYVLRRKDAYLTIGPHVDD